MAPGRQTLSKVPARSVGPSTQHRAEAGGGSEGPAKTAEPFQPRQDGGRRPSQGRARQGAGARCLRQQFSPGGRVRGFFGPSRVTHARDGRKEGFEKKAHPYPQTPSRSGEGGLLEKRASFSPSPFRGGGFGGRGLLLLFAFSMAANSSSRRGNKPRRKENRGNPSGLKRKLKPPEKAKEALARVLASAP